MDDPTAQAKELNLEPAERQDGSLPNRLPRPGVFLTMGRRKEFFSDRTWYGAGLICIGTGAPENMGGGWFYFLLLLLVPGLLLVRSGVSRARSRVDPVSGQVRPGPPW